MNNISAVIVAKDNPPHLFETVASIQNFVKEIIIADIGIDPQVVSKLKEINKVRIITIKKSVLYVELVREELKQYASEDYLLYIDPDEIVPEALVKILSSKYDNYDYVKIPRKNIIFGKWIEHSRWWPDYQVRLFKKDAVTWPKEIHKQPQVKGNGHTIEAKEEYAIIHYNYESIDEYLEKALRYAKAEANGLRSFSLAEALKKALSEFISRYFAEEGYKDGIHGFVLAFLQMFYYVLVYVYYWERKKYQEEANGIKEAQSFFQDGLKQTSHWLIQKKLVSWIEKLRIKIRSVLTKLV